VERHCFIFFKENKDDVINTQGFIEVDEDTQNIFLASVELDI